MADLNHIALFAKVVEAGSFSGAARALAMPKATISRKVAQLEEALGARLLQRTTRRVTLTALGRAYYEDAARGLASIERAKERIAASQAEPAGTLRITAPVGFGARKLMRWIGEFLQAHEKVRIVLKLTDDPIDLIGNGIDLAFRTGKLPDSSLITRRLGTSRLALVASPGYLGRRGCPQRIEDLKTHDCVAFGPSLDNEVWRLKGPRGWREVPVHARIAVDGSYAEVQAALAGLGIALLPLALIRHDIETGRLEQVLAEYGVDGGSMNIVYPSNRHMSAALRAFLDFIVVKTSSPSEQTPAQAANSA
ncbi:LysR family transcriptional regulator [Chelativorans xinjiangense]|uniref:LysR family transcriptional regulator n=1 Tax=Chelativorans xinjiangense TaxID=2681485 RepID=UPI00135B6346|nr:LysR family transcriptional regulator [Chelativorans xinjiangense]